jgi:hypothetical protein
MGWKKLKSSINPGFLASKRIAIACSSGNERKQLLHGLFDKQMVSYGSRE